MKQVIKVLAATVQGIAGRLFEIEVATVKGAGGYETLGLSEAAACESRVRVVSALRQEGIRLAGTRVTVRIPEGIGRNVALADLPMALGVLVALGKLPADALAGRLVLGELSLDGLVRPVPGILPMVLAAREAGIGEVLVPVPSIGEAAVASGIRCCAALTLSAVVEHITGREPLPTVAVPIVENAGTIAIDLADVSGQAHVKRALEIAAAGGHPVLMVGPPGSGKTMLSRRLVTLLPPMTEAEMIEVTSVHSVAGLLRRRPGMVTQRPFRAPHHTCSPAAIAGGGTPSRPGEVSLAHHGVLFIDELTGWRRDVLEVLMQARSRRQVTSGRCGDVTYPADFLPVFAMNPCPCGWHSDPRHRCSCSPDDVVRYRLGAKGVAATCDIQVEVPAVPFRDMTRRGGGETSEAVRARVVRAREAQAARGPTLNANLSPTTATGLDLPPEAERLMEAACSRLSLGPYQVSACVL
ncbi:MAG: YifB family Mg chelatase-like AAA ATPase, partial [Deltaproteobacteria bacterium]|nr:YifB family Mg chelatase-like AAA ATPase [Deltaproteobacteria bacterium]